MKIRAVIFDIYNTVLRVGPPPPDADDRWLALHRQFFQSDPKLDLEQFKNVADEIIAREHAAAKAVGIAFPEICWPNVVAQVFPETSRLQRLVRDAFILGHTRLLRTVSLMPGAAATLDWLYQRGTLMGIASNCQAYTLAELKSELARAELNTNIFHPAVRFLSFEHGFSKPNPHAFRFIAAQLCSRGIPTQHALMVGDRMDNDILPARAQGFQTWRLAAGDDNGGDWNQLHETLKSADC